MTRNGLLFGTDGVRGTVNAGFITPQSLVNLALATASWLRQTQPDAGSRPMVIIAKDTRLSGYMLETAMTSGFLAMGFDVKQLGPMPTPALARLTQAMRADLGVMITASHNPYSDNGIKLFTGAGFKLSDEQQNAIVKSWHSKNFRLPESERLGRAKRLVDAQGRYIEMLKADMPSRFSLPRIKVVVDCANGAAYRVAPLILHELGADVVPVNVSPDGTNINRGCGALHIQNIVAATREHGAEVGMAFDGDGDRLMLVDGASRNVYDGDAIMVLLAELWPILSRARFRIPMYNRLTGAVGTSQTNSGVARYFRRRKLTFVRSSQVGDRYVKATMCAHKLPLGSEPSGHILLGDDAAVGDALAAAITLLAGMGLTGKSLPQLIKAYRPLPAERRDVHFCRPVEAKAAAASPAVAKAVERARSELGASGRVVLRAAGTEPAVRLLVEAEQADLSMRIADRLEAAISGVSV